MKVISEQNKPQRYIWMGELVLNIKNELNRVFGLLCEEVVYK